MKIAYILRGVPGAGKSTLAKNLKGKNGVICEADDYFYDEDGNYKFDMTKLAENHLRCFTKWENAIKIGVSTIIQSNTNATKFEFENYKKVAEEGGYTVFVLIVENYHNNKSIHNIDENKRQFFAKKLERNIKLK